MTVSRETPDPVSSTAERAERSEVRAFVHGVVNGSLTKAFYELYPDREWVIDQETDPSTGLYLHYTDVTMPSGIKLRVQVEVL